MHHHYIMERKRNQRVLLKKRVSYLAKEGRVVEHLSNFGIVLHDLSCLGIGHHHPTEHFWIGHHVLFLTRTKQRTSAKEKEGIVWFNSSIVDLK